VHNGGGGFSRQSRLQFPAPQDISQIKSQAEFVGKCLFLGAPV